MRLLAHQCLNTALRTTTTTTHNATKSLSIHYWHTNSPIQNHHQQRRQCYHTTVSTTKTSWNRLVPVVRTFSTTPPTPSQEDNYHPNDTKSGSSTEKEDDTTPPTPTPIAYTAPFASLALRLKRVSISSAILSLTGVPFLIFMQGGGSGIPASGQLAVGGTAVLAATGSTAALSYCFSPYVSELEWIPVRCPSCITGDDGGDEKEEEEDANGNGVEDGDGSTTKGETVAEEHRLVKAKTRNIFALPVETIFDPNTDVVYEGVAKKTNRPFCNFIAKGVPLYVHPELIQDEELRFLLLGTGPKKGGVVSNQGKKGEDEDFL